MNWKDDAAYVKSLRDYIFLTVVLFLASAILGFLAASNDPELAISQIEEFGNMFEWILNLSPPLIMLAIFLNNLIASIVAMLLGVGFGIVPAIISILNGFMIGIVAYYAIEVEGVAFLVAAILPHGIIELPTVLICISVGFRLGHLLLLALMGRKVDLGGEMRSALSLLKWVVLLLLLAAMIETFITPVLIQHFIDPQPLSVME